MTLPTYSLKLGRYVINDRHQWLLIKKRLGPISISEKKEVVRFENQIETGSMEVKSQSDKVFDDLIDDEEIDEITGDATF